MCIRDSAITALLCLLTQLPLADTASARAIHALSKMFPFKDHRGSALGIDLADEASGRITVCPSLIQMAVSYTHLRLTAWARMWEQVCQ